jgi:dsRNA-specific ribonuclease
MQTLQDFVKNILSKYGGVKNPEVLEKVTSSENLEMYEQAFISPSIDPDHSYETYEFLGDAGINKCIVFHLYHRFPQLQKPLGYKVLARLKILYVSKNIFQHIGDEKLGFLPYIKVSQEVLSTQKYKVLTDVLEAFIAVTELIFDKEYKVGIGYAIINEIVSRIFSEIKIDLKYESLYDSVTRVKEIFEFREFKAQLGTYKYEYSRDDTGVTCKVVSKGSIIGMGKGHSQGAAQHRAAEEAYKFLVSKGFKKPLAEPWASLEKA